MRPRTALLSLLIGIAAIVFPGSGFAATAGTVPTALRGAWFAAHDCGNVSGYVFIGHAAMVSIFNDEGQHVSIAAPLAVLAGGSSGSLTVKVGGERQVWKPGADTLDAQPANAPELHLIRCADPQVNGTTWPFYSSYLRGVTRALGSLDALSLACSTNEQVCASGLMHALDLNKDGKISRAEIVAFLRSAAKLSPLLGEPDLRSGAIVSHFSTADIPGIELGTATFGPFAAQLVMANVDYDGDGFIEPQELSISLDQLGFPRSSGSAVDLIALFQHNAGRAVQALQALQQLLSALGNR